MLCGLDLNAIVQVWKSEEVDALLKNLKVFQISLVSSKAIIFIAWLANNNWLNHIQNNLRRHFFQRLLLVRFSLIFLLMSFKICKDILHISLNLLCKFKAVNGVLIQILVYMFQLLSRTPIFVEMIDHNIKLRLDLTFLYAVKFNLSILISWKHKLELLSSSFNEFHGLTETILRNFFLNEFGKTVEKVSCKHGNE